MSEVARSTKPGASKERCRKGGRMSGEKRRQRIFARMHDALGRENPREVLWLVYQAGYKAGWQAGVVGKGGKR